MSGYEKIAEGFIEVLSAVQEDVPGAEKPVKLCEKPCSVCGNTDTHGEYGKRENTLTITCKFCGKEWDETITD